ncbi:hypothetical protein [Paraburkholderia sediminicola]|uniref:hypothetical protein n=1 Tax=Paraburkholderia sediminicola TaxID=458836 RepID=UPI0038BC1A50
MVNPHPRSLKRRALELEASATRELEYDVASAALLMFYAAECSLKHVYMTRHNLKHTEDERGNARSALSFGHDLIRLVGALNIPKKIVGGAPKITYRLSGERGEVIALHQAWRYGVTVESTDALFGWLRTITTWCRKNS